VEQLVQSLLVGRASRNQKVSAAGARYFDQTPLVELQLDLDLDRGAPYEADAHSFQAIHPHVMLVDFVNAVAAQRRATSQRTSTRSATMLARKF
jgi:hypothetical protein